MARNEVGTILRDRLVVALLFLPSRTPYEVVLNTVFDRAEFVLLISDANIRSGKRPILDMQLATPGGYPTASTGFFPRPRAFPVVGPWSDPRTEIVVDLGHQPRCPMTLRFPEIRGRRLRAWDLVTYQLQVSNRIYYLSIYYPSDNVVGALMGTPTA